MKRIKQLRKAHKMKQIELCKMVGITQGALSGWENGRFEPDIDALKQLAEIFDCSIGYIIGHEDDPDPATLRGGKRIPVLGTIVAGIPIEAIEEVLDYEEIPQKWIQGGREYFALKIKGCSMEPEYRAGDVVIFRKQNTCDNNADCAVLVNGDEATFKRVERLKEGIILKPLNPTYESKFYSNEEIEKLPVTILGVFWELRRSRKI